MSSDPGLPHGAPPTAPPQPWPSAGPGYGQPAGYSGAPPPGGYGAGGYDPAAGYGGYQAGSGAAAPGGYGAQAGPQRYGQQPGAGYGPPAGAPPAPSGYGQPGTGSYTQASAPPYGTPGPGYGAAAPPPPPQYGPGYGQPQPQPQPGYGSQLGYGGQGQGQGQGQQPWLQPQQSFGYGGYGQQPGYGGYGVAELFPPGTDPEVIRMFQQADRDGSGLVDDVELQKVLSVAHPFSLRTVHLLILTFSATCALKIKPVEFATLWKNLKDWRKIFDEHDLDRSGRMDVKELGKALLSMGCAVSGPLLKVLVTRYDRTGLAKSIDYDNFVECALVVKGLTEKFKEKDVRFQGSATLTYEDFMLMVLPFVTA